MQYDDEDADDEDNDLHHDDEEADAERRLCASFGRPF